MDNLFKSNLTVKHVQSQDNLRTNIEFCKKLIKDIEQTFNVITESKRRDEFTQEIIVYSPKQVGRYTYGFTFSATNDGVIFSDGRGVWLTSMAKILNTTITDKYEDKIKDLTNMRKVAKAIDIEVMHSNNTSCGDHFRLKMSLSKNDPKLNQKIKAIIGTMMAQNVTTRL